MEFELHPYISMQTGMFNALIAPEEVMLAALNDNPALQRFLFLYVCGNYSRLLSCINRESTHIEVQRAFTAFQLLSILRDCHHTVVFVEHDHSLYEDAGGEVIDHVARMLKDAASDSLVILYAPKSSASFDAIGKRADRFFFLNAPGVPVRSGMRRPPVVRHRTSRQGQTTLEAF